MRLFSKLILMLKSDSELRRIALANKQAAERYRQERDTARHELASALSRIALLEGELLDSETEKKQLDAKVAVSEEEINILSTALKTHLSRYETELAMQERTRALANYERERSTQTG